MTDPNATDGSDGAATAAIAAIAVEAASEAVTANGTNGSNGSNGSNAADGAALPDAALDTTDLSAGGYARWRKSDERQNARRNRVLCLAIGLVALTVALAIAATAVNRSPDGTYQLHLVPLASAAAQGVVGAFLVVYSWLHYASVKSDFLDDYRREQIYKAIGDIEPPDVRQLIILNQRRMDQYHQMTLAQAADAWQSSQLAMTAGLVVLVAGITVALAASTGTASKIVIASLTGVGSALSGYVAGTFLRARRQSLRQLNFYFHQPLATSYLLTAERIAAKIPDESTKVEVWKTLAGQIAIRAFDVEGDSGSTKASASSDHHK